MAWVIGYEAAWNNLSSEKHTNRSFGEGEIGYIEITFASSGLVHIYTDGDIDTIGFLSTSPLYNTETGRPSPESKILAEDDDAGDGSNFDFTCDVEEGTTYYILYRHYREDFSGGIPLHVIFEEEESPAEWSIGMPNGNDEISEVYSCEYDFDPGVAIRFKLQPLISGTMTVYSEGNTDVIAFISESSSFDYELGEPQKDFESDDDGADFPNFRLTYNVEADETYYLWVRCVDIEDSGLTTIYIEPPNEYPPPTTDSTSLTADVSGTSVVLEIVDLNPDYNYNYTYSVTWTVYRESDNGIFYMETLRSDEDDDPFDITLDGLIPGFDYIANVEVRGYLDIINIEETYWEDSIAFTAEDFPDMTGVHIAPQETDNPSTEIAFRLEGLDERYSQYWDIDWYVYKDGSSIKDFTDDSTSGSKESATITVTGLTPATAYSVRCRIRYYDYYNQWTTMWVYGYEGDYTTSENYTESGAQIIAESSADGTTITAYVKGLDTNYPRDGRWINWYLDGIWDGQTEGIPAKIPDTKYDPYLFVGLEKSAEYTIRAEIHYVNNGSDATKDLYISIKTLGGRPTKFNWKTDKVKGQLFNLTAQEWCDLLENINAVRAYKGYNTIPEGSTSVSNYYNYFTYPDSGDDFLHKHYNQALNGITGMLGYGYSANERQKGDSVTADCLNLLVEMINSIE